MPRIAIVRKLIFLDTLGSISHELIRPDDKFLGLIFDCDGTLVDTAPTHLHAYNVALRHFGLGEMSAEFYRPRFGLPPDILIQEFVSLDGAAADVNAIVEAYALAFQSDLSRLREITPVASVARTYRGRVPMAVGSNGRRINVERTLSQVGLRDLFDVVVTIEDVRRGKPEPDIYLLAAERIGIEPSHCIVFEDTEEGLEAARTGGMVDRDVRLSYP